MKTIVYLSLQIGINSHPLLIQKLGCHKLLKDIYKLMMLENKILNFKKFKVHYILIMIL
jgi:hypothetical protein